MKNQITCTEISCSSLEDIDFHTSTLFKNYIIIYGGYSMSRDKILSDIQIFNLKKNSFEEFNLEGDEPSARSTHSACLVDQNKILVFGGTGHNSILNTTAMITIKETLPLTLTYKEIMTTGGDGLLRSNHSADIYQNKMYVFGGRHLDEPKMESNNELWSLDLDTFDWQICETTGEKPEPRAAHSSVVFNQKLYIFGGYVDSKNSGTNSCSVLSFESKQWENLENKGKSFLPRYGASSVVINDTFFIMGGYYQSERTSNKILTFDFEKNTFGLLKCPGDYIPVIGGKAVSYRKKIILWGGLKDDTESISKILCLQSSQKDLESVFEGANESFSSYADPLFSSEEFADIHFSIEGQQIPAHKLILCLRCKYFANLFKSDFSVRTPKNNRIGGMKESNSSVIEITDVKLETFKAFLRFLYQNEAELTEALALDLYALADKYMQSQLMRLCESFLAKNLRLDNLVGLIDFVEKFEIHSLKDSIFEFMMKNLKEIKQNQNNYPIPSSYIWEVASQFQQNFENLKIQTE